METITVVCRGASTEELAKLATAFSSFRVLAPNVFHGGLRGKFSIDLREYVTWAAEPHPLSSEFARSAGRVHRIVRRACNDLIAPR